MASVYERGSRWYVRVKDEHGRWKDRVCSAATKTEAKRLAAELERQAERRRLGLEAGRPADGGGTVQQLLGWWLRTYSKGSPSHDRNESTVRTHFFGTALGDTLVCDLKSSAVEVFLQAKAGGLSPQTLNHLRRFLLTAFNCGRRAGRLEVPNPVAGVKPRKVPPRLYDYLRAEEVPAVLAQLSERQRPLFAAAIYTGLRKGELLSLRKADVDAKARQLIVRRSWDRDTTKGGHADAVPLAAEVVPFLEAAMRASPSDLVFPNAEGGMMRPDVALESILRRAMGRAGLVTGYRHVCRRKGCTHAENAPDGALRRCPLHSAKLWPKPQVRQLRFHDLRHTTASLLMQSGTSLAAVARVLRHTDPKLTARVYGHLAPAFMLAEVDRLKLGVEAPRVEAMPLAANSGPFAAPVLQATEREKENPGAALISQATPGVSTARSRGLEPLTFGVTGSPAVRPTRSSPSQTMPFRKVDGAGRVQPVAETPTNHSQFAAPVLQGIRGGAENLLTVRQVAERLSVSTFTVYGLCERGELQHVRVSNSIRVSPSALRAFVERAPR